MKKNQQETIEANNSTMKKKRPEIIEGSLLFNESGEIEFGNTSTKALSKGFKHSQRGWRQKHESRESDLGDGVLPIGLRPNVSAFTLGSKTNKSPSKRPQTAQNPQRRKKRR